MARGIGAVVVLVALVLAMTILSGIGYLDAMGADLDVESQNQDVQDAADELSGIGFGEDRSDAILDGPLAIVTPVIGMLQVTTAIVGNTSGVLQLLYGLPKVPADTIELMFRFAMMITLAFLIRGAVQ